MNIGAPLEAGLFSQFKTLQILFLITGEEVWDHARREEIDEISQNMFRVKLCVKIVQPKCQHLYIKGVVHKHQQS